jgi:hypothetical protein
LEPFAPGFVERFHVFPVIPTGNYRTNGDGQDIHEFVQLGPIDARIGQVAKMLFDGSRNIPFDDLFSQIVWLVRINL